MKHGVFIRFAVCAIYFWRRVLTNKTVMMNNNSPVVLISAFSH